jgi:hypothetical protein
LGDFEECASDPIPVADAHCIIVQAFDREILSGLSEGLRIAQLGPLEPLLPITVRFDLVNKDRPLFTSVPRPITLGVSVQI